MKQKSLAGIKPEEEKKGELPTEQKKEEQPRGEGQRMRGGARSGRRRPRGGPKDGEETKNGGQRYEDKGSNPFADKKPGDGPQSEKQGNRNAKSARPKTGDQLQDGERPQRNNKTPR